MTGCVMIAVHVLEADAEGVRNAMYKAGAGAVDDGRYDRGPI
jgi:hypothetical protein